MTRRLAVLVPIVLGIASLAWAQFRGGGSHAERLNKPPADGIRI